MCSLVSTCSQRSAVHEIDARAFTKQIPLDEQNQGNCHFFFEFHETVVRDNPREKIIQILTGYSI